MTEPPFIPTAPGARPPVIYGDWYYCRECRGWVGGNVPENGCCAKCGTPVK